MHHHIILLLLLFPFLLLGCGDGGVGPAATAKTATSEVAYYTCPMHPTVHQAEPGACPICGMTLVPVLAEDMAAGVVRIDDSRRQAFGVRTAVVARGPLVAEVTAPGRIVPDETRITEVTLQVDGFIRDLRVDHTGQQVARGQTLFTLYSPMLVSTQRELLSAVGRDPALAQAARDRLRRFGISDQQVSLIEAGGVVVEELPIPSPASGRVMEKMAVAGMALMMGQPLYRLAPIDPVWVEADVYEADTSWVALGMRATLTLPAQPGRSWVGTIEFLDPQVDPVTRTRRARVALANRDGVLLPGMLGQVALRAQGEEGVVVPEEAVVHAGARDLAWIDLGEDRLAPRELHLGRRTVDGWEVLHGLEPGEVVVVSGNFLVAAETRIRTGAGTSAPAGHDHGSN